MIANLTIDRFTQHADTGNEYKLRYEKSQAGQIEYVQRLMSLFPTPAATRAGCFQRSNEAVAWALANDQFVLKWRELYQVMPSNAITIVSRWLLKMLSNNDDENDLKAAACFVFASRSTNEFIPTIELYCGLLCACWQVTEKTGVPRLLPLIYEGISKQDYERLANVLPRIPIWSSYRQIHALLDELQIPKGGRKNNLPRVMLIGLLDNAQWKNPAFDLLMSKMPRGRADLFNLALGHISRSFLLWTYMGMTVMTTSVNNNKSSVSSSTSSTSATSLTSSTRKQFIPTTITNITTNTQQPLFITEQLSEKLESAKQRLLAAEQEALKAKQQLKQLELEAIHESTTQQQFIIVEQQQSKTSTKQSIAPQTEPIPRHQTTVRLPDILSLSDDENENSNLNDITRRLADSFISIDDND